MVYKHLKLLSNNQIENKYLKSCELANVLGVSIHTIRAWRRDRKITPLKFSRSVRWHLPKVLEELSKRSTK